MPCLKAKIKGVIIDVTPQSFKYHDFKGADIISGDKYYIEKAVTLGAIKPKAKKKAKAKDYF